MSVESETEGNLTGIYLPENTTRDVSDFETAPTTGFFDGLGLSAAESLSSGPTLSLLSQANTFLSQDARQGKKLTKDEWEKSDLFRESLSFDKLKTSGDGVPESVARAAAHRLDVKEATQARLGRMNPGLLSVASRFAGSSLGFVLDPINVAAFKGANFMMGKTNSSILEKIGETSLATTRKAGVGFSEFALATIPSAAVEFESDTVYGEDPSAINAIATIGLNAGLGGLIRGKFGFHQPITRKSYREAVETAANQMSAGKSVHVDEIINNGYRDARLNDKGEIENISPEERASIVAKQSENKKTIESLENEEVSIKDKEAFDKKVKGIVSEDKPLHAKDIIKKGKEILEKPDFKRTASDRLFLKKLPLNDEIKKSLTISGTPKELRTPQDEQFLSDMINGKEEEFINKRVSEHKESSELIEKEIGEKSPEEAQRLSKELDGFNEKISHAENRLFEIKGSKKPTKRITEVRKEISKRKKENNILENQIKHHETEDIIQQDSGRPVDINALKASSKKINSYEGDSVVNKERNDAYNKDAESIPEKPEVSDLDEMQAIVDSLELSEEDKEILEEGKEVASKFERIKKSIAEAVDCLVRNPV